MVTFDWKGGKGPRRKPKFDRRSKKYLEFEGKRIGMRKFHRALTGDAFKERVRGYWLNTDSVYKFLESRIGQKWDDVYSEIRKRCPKKYYKWFENSIFRWFKSESLCTNKGFVIIDGILKYDASGIRGIEIDIPKECIEENKKNPIPYFGKVRSADYTYWSDKDYTTTLLPEYKKPVLLGIYWVVVDDTGELIKTEVYNVPFPNGEWKSVSLIGVSDNSFFYGEEVKKEHYLKCGIKYYSVHREQLGFGKYKTYIKTK